MKRALCCIWLVAGLSMAVNAQNFDFTALIDMPVSTPAFKDFMQAMGRPVVTAYANKHYYASFYVKGFELLVYHKKVKAVFFHDKKLEQFSSFSRRLPNGLTWGMGKKEVRRRLGPPKATGTSAALMNQKVKHWDNYAYPRYTLHITYDDYNEVYEVAIMSPDMKG